MMDWLGRATIDFTTSPTPLGLSDKDGKATDLLRICEKTVPPCQLNPLLFNGHLQTVWTATKAHGPPIHYKRRIFAAENKAFDGTFAVDFAVPSAAEEEVDETLPPRTTYFSEAELSAMGSDDSRPMLVILHGLSGGSHEIYLRHAIAPLVDSGRWEACVVNSRGCAKSKITTGLLYNARATWDTRQVVKWLRNKYPNRPLFGLGFSLGACILTNYLGEEGPAAELKAAVVCANPWNLDVSNKMLESSYIGHEVYLRTLGSKFNGPLPPLSSLPPNPLKPDSLRALATQHRAEIEKYNADVDMAELFRVRYLYEFDRAYQCPTWGYPTEGAYYRDASSVDALLSVRVPLLALNALDDPIAARAALPLEEARANPNVVLCTTSLGGHLGWFEIGGGRWHAKPICNFLNHMAFEVDLNSIRASKEVPEPKLSQFAGTFDPASRRMRLKIAP
ncbi:Alpha/Beta hydrolase protein [Camillea tinctor]|nr:Alpha/Beta hydrolase protein [Camillea tinctor]